MLKPFFCFYGGKWRAAPRYPRPEHSTIVEPFAGAAGYATRHAEREVILVERDPKVAALWRFLIRARREEVEAIPADVPGTVEELKCCEEARFLVGFWVNKGSAAPRNVPTTWMRGGTRPNSYWGRAVRARIAAQVERVKHWRLIEGSWESAPDVEATWFVDPPYDNLAGEHYVHGRAGIDYVRLGEWVKNRKGLTIACENEGASWLPFVPFHAVAGTMSKRGGARSAEAVYVQRT